MTLDAVPRPPEPTTDSSPEGSTQAKLLASVYDDPSFLLTDDTTSSANHEYNQVASLLSGVWGSGLQDLDVDTANDANLVEVGYRGNGVSARSLSSLAHSSVGRTDLGSRVPSNAREFANYRVPSHLKCASTVSDWLIDMGAMNSHNFKIRVADLNSFLHSRFGGQRLRGDFDLSDFPQGPIGFISGTGHVRNGSNHVGFVERQGNQVFIIHNKGGQVVRENIKDKFYNSNGDPLYRNMKLFRVG